MRTGAML